MQEQHILDRIRTLYPNSVIETSGENCNFEVFIVSDAFEGVNLLKRQQAILGLFSEELKSGKLHAIGIRAKTLEEFNQATSNLIQIG